MTARQKEIFINLLRMHIGNLETRLATGGEDFSDGYRRDYMNKIALYNSELLKAKGIPVPEEDPLKCAYDAIVQYKPEKGSANELIQRHVLANIAIMQSQTGYVDLALVECVPSPNHRHSLVDADNEGPYGKQTCRYCGKEVPV